jgi:hypothetical protein
LDFVSKKEFAEPVYGRNYRANYHNGEFYINDAEGVTVFDGDLNVVERYPVEGPENEILTFAVTYDGEPYLFLTKPETTYGYYYYFRPLDGDEFIQIDVPPSLLFSIAYGLTPGDSEYPLYGELWGFGYWSELMNYDFDGRYVVGLNMDGSYDKILLDNMSFYAAVPSGGKRYSVIEESEHVEANTYKLDLYLYEYTAVYED